MKSKICLMVMLSALMAFSLVGCTKKKPGNEANVNKEETQPSPNSNGDSTMDENSIIIGIPQDLDSLDPHNAKAAGTREVLFNIFEGLLKPTSNGELVGAVAGEYEILDEGLTYIFTLRDGVKFHNGTEVTIHDVEASLKRCAGGDGKEPIIPAFSYIEEISTEGNNKIIVKLGQKHPEILYSFTAAIVPASVIQEDSISEVIGTGPYKFEKRELQNFIQLKKNEEYYGEKANIETVRFKVVADSNMIATELKSGAVHMFARITDVQAAEAAENCNILEGSMNLVQALYLNNSSEPLKNETVRKALNYAINRQAILDLVFAGKGTVIGSSMIPSFERYYVPELASAYKQDVEKAKKLLEEAGYPNGFDLEITVPSNYQQHVDTAQVIVEQLKEIGVNAVIKPVDWSTWLSEVYTDRKYQSTVIGVDASTLSAEAFLSRFCSDAHNNFINFMDEDYDMKYNEAQEYEDLDEQALIYQECEKILSDRAANVYIQDMSSMVALNKNYDGYVFYPLYIIDAAKLRKVK